LLPFARSLAVGRCLGAFGGGRLAALLCIAVVFAGASTIGEFGTIGTGGDAVTLRGRTVALGKTAGVKFLGVVDVGQESVQVRRHITFVGLSVTKGRSIVACLSGGQDRVDLDLPFGVALLPGVSQVISRVGNPLPLVSVGLALTSLVRPRSSGSPPCHDTPSLTRSAAMISYSAKQSPVV
jgi:hypothetical protein